jgi:hypothetical protein
MDNPDSLTTRIAALSVADSATDSTAGGDGDNEVHAFSIICSDGQTLAVPEQDARMVLSSCEYFCNMFRHNTVESASRIIRKPDWSYEVAKHVMEYFCNGGTMIPYERLTDFRYASSQILIEAMTFSGRNLTLNSHQLQWIDVATTGDIVRRGSKLPLTINISKRIEYNRLRALLVSGIAIVDLEYPWVCVHNPRASSISNDIELPYSPWLHHKRDTGFVKKQSKTQFASLQLYSSWPSCTKDEFEFILEELVICPSMIYMMDDYPLAEAYILLVMNAASVSKGLQNLLKEIGYSSYEWESGSIIKHHIYPHAQGRKLQLFGTFRRLHKVLSELDRELIADCASRTDDGERYKGASMCIRICKMKYMMQLVQVSGSCTRHPNTLGFLPDYADVYAIKSIDDIVQMLQCLMQGVVVPDDIHTKKMTFVELTGPTGVF